MQEVPILEMRGVRKQFGPTLALDGVDLEIRPGEVHAILGENGAGKSTLMKILAGALQPDQGEMRLGGQHFQPGGPKAARAAGVSIVYQELNLAPHLSVEANLTLGIEVNRYGVLQSKPTRETVATVLKRLNRPDLQAQSIVATLSPAARQLVEIGRALMTDAKVLILDEPTSSLGLDDIEHLFTVIRQLRAQGVAVFYISHFLEEVRQIADRFTVLRDGSTVKSGRLEDVTMDDLVEAMIGRQLEQMFPRVPHEVGKEILYLSELSGHKLPQKVDLHLHRGEVLGIAGLVGAGRTELLRTLFGLDKTVHGRVEKDQGAVILRNADPGQRWRVGIGIVSEDRAQEGLCLQRTLEENLTWTNLRSFSRGGWLPLGRLREAAQTWLEKLGVKARSSSQYVRELSGGNQQKVAIGRLLQHDVDVFLLDEPTRGIDVASKAEIYQLIGELAAAGKSVLMVSSYTPELLGVCDRVAVMHRGQVVDVRPGTDWTEDQILHCAARGASGSKDSEAA